MELIVSAIRMNGDDNIDIELKNPNGEQLPPFTPGAHIDIRTPSGALRQYSLCSPADERFVYQICVRQDESSRGGSRSLHSDLRVRAKLEVAGPRNLFDLPESRRYLLFSAGIGITPIISMARRLKEGRKSFELHHFEKSRSRVAFLEELTCGGLGKVATLHLGEDGVSFRDQAPICLDRPDGDTVVIACGPNGFLDLLGERLAKAGWSQDQFHFERFRAEAPATRTTDDVTDSFEVHLASSRRTFSVSATETIAEVLRANGIAVDLSCEQGMCGACLTDVVSGIPDHRDMILTDAEKAANNRIAICCSRACSATLTLDL